MLTEKLKLLSEDQIDIILYCVNNGKLGKEKDYFFEDLKYIKPMYAYRKLNEFAPKIKPEYHKMMQDIVDSCINMEF